MKNMKNGKTDLSLDRFEVHKWLDQRLPIIFHTDTADGKTEYGAGNFHDSLELLLMLEGNGSVFTDFQSFPAEPGDLFVINSGSPHRIEGKPSLIYHCMIIGTVFCEENGFEPSAVKYVSKIRDEAMNRQYLAGVNALSLSKEAPFRTTAVRAEVLMLLNKLNQSYVVRKSADAAAIPDGIYRALGFLQTNFTRAVSTGEVAAVAGMSEFYFLRQFKEATGYTVVTYLNLLRCKFAVRQLLTTADPISAIAVSSGFENLSYFSKTFKRYIGILPSQVRKSPAPDISDNDYLQMLYNPPADGRL